MIADDLEHPCREMPTRHCPKVYNGVCGDDRPCARFESEDETPWLPELDANPRASHPCACSDCLWVARTSSTFRKN